jgi:hypothetical protein
MSANAIGWHNAFPTLAGTGFAKAWLAGSDAVELPARSAYFCRLFLTEAILNPFTLAALGSLLLTFPAFAEKLVDPTKVAPEYRDAAEKRRAEQLKQLECSHKADVAKVIPRERTAFLLQCLEAEAVK